MKSPLQVNLSSIPNEGLKISGTISFKDLDIAEEENISFPEPMEYELFLKYLEDKVFVKGRVSANIKCRCDRCLEDYLHEISNENVNFCAEDLDSSILDLTKQVREDILINFPFRFICDEDCLGLCPDCGENINLSRCKCKDKAKRSLAWSALDDLDV